MTSSSQSEHYFVYENRLASFAAPQPVAKRRTSTASTRAPKTLHWPHKRLSPVELAKAGFYFHPAPKNPDNVVCFLCNKAMDGWEEDDNPLLEHLKHSPSCGWAITAAIEAEIGEFLSLHPLDPRMVEARKATFAGKWPYESKKGFKCKTKQLVEAGWKYTPTIEADDMATCTYCQLALDGWEAGDKPIDEHYKRSPNCPYFVLLNEIPLPPKKSARSKASRLSVQSVATATSELASMADMTAEHDDSVMTTSSAMTQGSKKGRPRKGTSTAKGRKTRAKKDEVVEIHEDEPEDMEVTAPPPPPPKPARGRKRGSDAMEDSVLTNAEAPAPKKRATRTKGSAAVESSMLSQDAHVVEAPPAKQPTGRKKGRASSAKSTRKASQSSLRPQASTASLRGHVSDDDDELDRQLQADLERPLTDDEDLQADSDSERKKAPAKTKAPAPAPDEPTPAPAPARGRPRKGTTTRKASAQSQKQPATEDFAMFDPAPAQPDEAIIDAELRALEAEAAAQDVPLVQEQELNVPKKGRKTGTRKASKQTKKAKEASPPPAEPVDEPMEEAVPVQEKLPEPAQEPIQAPVPEPEISTERAEDHDVSTGTVITGGDRSSTGAKRGRGRPPKKSKTSLPPAEQPEEMKEPEQSTQPAASAIPAPVQVEVGETSGRSSFSAGKRSPPKVVSHVPVPSPAVPAPTIAAPTPAKRMDKSLPPPPASLPQAPGTPRVHATPSAKQAVISSSQSPQSSDAENQPPSARPTAAATAASATKIAKRVVLAPVPAATPARGYGSPSRRNVVAGLRSTTPWTSADLDAVFHSPGSKSQDGDAANKENGVDKLLRRDADLTSPEKRMTVEEWIFHNAGQAEQKLRHECEAMVSAFEKEGTRAMNVLEGLVVD